MAPSRLRSAAVRIAPLAIFAALAEWTAVDLVRFAPASGWALGGVALAVAAAGVIQGTRSARSAWHRGSRALLASVFIGERIFAAGIDVLAMIAFLVLLIALASLQALERTFAPVYDAAPEPALLSKVDSAALAAYARVLGLAGFTFVVSVLLVQIIPLAAVPSRSLGVVLGLALALLLVIGGLALTPGRPAKRRA